MTGKCIPRDVALFMLEHASPTDPPCGQCDYRVGRSWDRSISGFNGCKICRESDRQASYVYLRDPQDVAHLRELMADAPYQHEGWSPPASRGKVLPGTGAPGNTTGAATGTPFRCPGRHLRVSD